MTKASPMSYARERVKNTPRIVWVVAGGGGVYYGERTVSELPKNLLAYAHSTVFHLERTETGRLRFLDTTVADERQMGEMVC